LPNQPSTAPPPATAVAATPGGATPAAAAAADSIVDDAQSAAAGTRQAAKWFASALAAIPALGIVGSLIKGPGSAGFDPIILFFGLALAAAGAYLGIYFFSKVITPIPLEDRDMNPDADLSRLPGQPYGTNGELMTSLKDSRFAYARYQYRSEKAKVISAIATQTAADAEANAERMKNASDHDKANAALKQQALDAKAHADQSRSEAAARAAASAGADQEAIIWANQVQGIEKIRTQAFHLKASDLVGKRFREAQRAAILAAVLVAFGVFLLAIAPKQAAAGPSQSVVTLHVSIEKPTPTSRSH
jgi:hypothetical protein